MWISAGALAHAGAVFNRALDLDLTSVEAMVGIAFANDDGTRKAGIPGG